MGQNRTKEVWNGMKQMAGCSKPLEFRGDLEFATELNTFYYNRSDTTPSPVCSDNMSGSPSTITHTSAVDSALLLSMATSPSLSSTMTLKDSPSSPSPSSSLLPYTSHHWWELYHITTPLPLHNMSATSGLFWCHSSSLC